MSRTVTISIEASAPDTDAPTVDDLLAQLRDYFDLLDIVEEMVAADGQSAIQWRVVNAAKASPLSFTLQAFARQYAVNVDKRVDVVLATAHMGLAHLADLGDGNGRIPGPFNDDALQKARAIFERVTNGLGRTTFEATDSPVLAITPSVARLGLRNVQAQLAPAARPYQEFGSVEGYVESVTLDGWGRRVLYLKNRMTGDEVKCFVTGDAEREFALREIGDVWRKRRVSVYGLIHYRAPGRITQIEVTSVRFLKTRSELPDVDDIIDIDFTGGMKSEEYLAKLRDGEST